MHWQGGQIAISVMVLGWGSRCPRFQLDLESKLKISWDTKFSSTFKSNYLLYFMETLTNVSTNKIALANMNAHWKIVNSSWLEKHGRPPIFIYLWKSVHVGPHRHVTAWAKKEGCFVLAYVSLILCLNNEMGDLKEPMSSLSPPLVWKLKWWASHSFEAFLFFN